MLKNVEKKCLNNYKNIDFQKSGRNFEGIFQKILFFRYQKKLIKMFHLSWFNGKKKISSKSFFALILKSFRFPVLLYFFSTIFFSTFFFQYFNFSFKMRLFFEKNRSKRFRKTAGPSRSYQRWF